MSFLSSAIRHASLPLILAATGCFIGSIVFPTPSHAFVLTKATFSGGATAVSGGSFVLGATTGEAGVVGSVSGGSFRLIEGFWLPNIGVPSSVAAQPATDPTPPAAEVIHYVNALSAARPNPSHGNASMSFTVADPSPVALALYDVGGRRVRTLAAGSLAAGRHDVSWDGRDDQGHPLASGIYFARLTIGDWSASRRLLRIQ